MESLVQIYRHRVLLQVLIARDLKARYRGTFLGFLWSFLSPLMMMATYFLVFSVYLRIEMENYAGFLLTGLLAWNCFSAGLLDATNSLVANSSMIRNVSVPSQLFPIVAIGSHTVHFLLSLPILLAILALTGVRLTPAVFLLPVLVVLQSALACGFAFVLSAATVRFRDVAHLVPNVLTMLFFATPILYPIGLVPEQVRPILAFNPLSAMTVSYQQVLFWGSLPSPTSLAILVGAAATALALGLAYFDWCKDEFSSAI